MTTNINDILQLPVDERLEIMEKIWESLDDKIEDTEIKLILQKKDMRSTKKIRLVL